MLTLMAAYMELRNFYGLFMMMSHEDFRYFTNPANDIGKLIQAHFIAMQMIMTPITLGVEKKDRKTAIAGPQGSTKKWLTTIHADIPPHLRDYFEWTLWIEDQVNHEKVYNGVYDD
jgi:hypothetical protein